MAIAVPSAVRDKPTTSRDVRRLMMIIYLLTHEEHRDQAVDEAILNN
jgi:hypothetical protein